MQIRQKLREEHLTSSLRILHQVELGQAVVSMVVEVDPLLKIQLFGSRWDPLSREGRCYVFQNI